MSKENLLDQNRIDSMIQAALTNDAALIPELQKMAERFSEPADALAAFLVGKIEWKYQGDFPCSKEQWQYFWTRRLEVGRDGRLFEKAIDGIQDKINRTAVYERFARIGHWTDYVHNGDHPAMVARAFGQNREYVENLLVGISPFPPEDRDDISRRNIYLAGISLAAAEGFIEFPSEKLETFIFAVIRWLASPRGGITTRILLEGGFNKGFGDLSSDLVHALAVFDEEAALELGKRDIPLRMEARPYREGYWVNGFRNSLPLIEGTPEVLAEKFAKAENPIEKFLIYRSYYTGSKKEIQNPDDPFGPKVDLFCHLTGHDGTEVSLTYEDAINYPQNKK